MIHSIVASKDKVASIFPEIRNFIILNFNWKIILERVDIFMESKLKNNFFFIRLRKRFKDIKLPKVVIFK